MRAMLAAALLGTASPWSPSSFVVEAAVADAGTVTTVTVDAPLYDTRLSAARGCDPSGCIGRLTRDGDVTTLGSRWSCRPSLGPSGSTCSIIYSLADALDIAGINIAMYQGNLRTRTVDILVDDFKLASWTSSGMTTGFENIVLGGVTGQTVELRGVLEDSEWLSILEVEILVDDGGGGHGDAVDAVEAGTITPVTPSALLYDTRSAVARGCDPNGCVASNTRDGETAATSRWSCAPKLGGGADATCSISYTLGAAFELSELRLYLWKGAERQVTTEVYVDGELITTWTSSGTTDGFESIGLTGTSGSVVDVVGVLDDSEWLSIIEAEIMVWPENAFTPHPAPTPSPVPVQPSTAPVASTTPEPSTVAGTPSPAPKPSPMPVQSSTAPVTSSTPEPSTVANTPPPALTPSPMPVQPSTAPVGSATPEPSTVAGTPTPAQTPSPMPLQPPTTAPAVGTTPEPTTVGSTPPPGLAPSPMPVQPSTAPVRGATPEPSTVEGTPTPALTPSPMPLQPPTTAPAVGTTPEPTPVGSTPPPGLTPSPMPVQPTTTPVSVVTPEPSIAPVAFTGDLLVDLVPCLFDINPIGENSEGMYVMSLFFKGYWTSKTEEYVVTRADDLTALLVDASDPAVAHGRCNAVYVGFAPSEEQAAALAAYSAQFKVRIVYFPAALTHTTPAFQAKLGIQTWFAAPIQSPAFIQLSAIGGTKVSITQPDLRTDPNLFDPPLFTYPVLQLSGVDIPGVEVLAEYADKDGIPIVAGAGGDQKNAAALTYTGADGLEEMHIFFTMGWFDGGAWPWAHYINEWATKGIFMGERRFYLGATVDDLFLSTPEFEFDGGLNEAAVEQRCTGEDLRNLLAVQQELNAKYPGSDVVTEFAFNGGGITEKIDNSLPDGVPYVPNYEETQVTLKGTKWFEADQGIVHDINWLATNVPLMQQDMAAGIWEANDDLLVEVIKHLDTPSTFFHGHHTLIHLSRDQLRESDCVTEDTGNVQIALMTGMWESDNYNWRSMVSPGITGLFNEYCLKSAAANLMKCYPGDNTFDGTVADATVLINKDNQFHSIYTTASNNGYDGAQIVPRFATYVYFNCVSGDCLVKENEYIRRFVCECTPLDPSVADYTCASTKDECFDAEGNLDIQSFGSAEAIFDQEAATTTRYMLTGRRDKYMFHQANIIPAGDVGDGTQSLLHYWYERVMQEFSKWITFPVKSIKFDDLCTDFKLHEALDDSSPYVTMALDEAGKVTGFSYVSGSGAGLVPLTVPTASASSIPITGLAVQATETFGTDTTYYLKDGDAAAAVRVGTKPDVSELAEVPQLVAVSGAEAQMEQSPALVEADLPETAANQQDNALVGAENGGFLGDDPLVDADVVVEAGLPPTRN